MWEGARFFHRGNPSSMLCTRRVGDERIEAAGRTFHERDCVLDIAHYDTRAAYDRRLALALGAPERAVALGVVVYPSSVGASLIGAGQVVAPDGYLRFEWFKELPACSDANLLRALAWPADKRVTR